MSKFSITKVKSRWILDSRGKPTVETDIWAGDVMARAAVPSGKSTGENEAVELRDGGKEFLGSHVSKAVSNVNDIIGPAIIGMECNKQDELDNFMIKELDKTPTKSKLGANAILSVSMAAAKLSAQLSHLPLYEYLYTVKNKVTKPREDYLMPVPMSNVLNGGKHAGGDLAIQEFMIMPVGAKSMQQGIQMIAEVYAHLAKIIEKKYGHTSINVGDEGGFAPKIDKTQQALDVILEAIQRAGFDPNTDVVLAIDAAATSFYENGKYKIDGTMKTPDELIDYYVDLINTYPIKSFEDPFEENDFDSFAALTKKVKAKCQIVDDDLTVTNTKILEKAIKMGSGNSLLLKVNQIGSLTEAFAAADMSYKNDYSVVVSHRSGETCDNTIADIAVALCSGFIKTGAPCRSERNSKYNQLLRIAEELGYKAKYPKSFSDWKQFL